MDDRKITQIMPAAGWGATFEEGDDELISPLVGWALVQEAGGKSAVIGLVAADEGVALCDGEPDFTGYVFLPDLLSDSSEADDDIFMGDDDFDEDDDLDDDDDLNQAPDDGPAFDPKAGLLN